MIVFRFQHLVEIRVPLSLIHSQYHGFFVFSYATCAA
jgi:hypothetical protein